MANVDRLKGANWFSNYKHSVLVGGVGGIGSWTSLFLTRAGFEVYGFDDDIVDETNLGGQLFKQSQVGTLKIEACYENIRDFVGGHFYGYNKRLDENDSTHRYFFSCFDNMTARQQTFAAWKKKYGEDENAIYIDGRLVMEFMQIYCIKGGDAETIKWFEENHLFDSSEVVEGACTMKQTTHSAAMIASHMVGFFTNFMGDKSIGAIVPKYYEYLIPLGEVSIKN